MSYPTSTFVLNNIHFSQVNNEIIVILNIYIQKGWNDFVYYQLKCLDFNKGLYVLGYLGVEQNENESWVDMSWLFHVKGWSVFGFKYLATCAFTRVWTQCVTLAKLPWRASPRDPLRLYWMNVLRLLSNS